MKNMVLRFLLGGTFIDVLVPEPEARIVLRDWKNGTLKGKYGNEFGSPAGYVVDLDKVIGINAVDVDEVKRQQQMSVGGNPNTVPDKPMPNASGVNTGVGIKL